ncbi:MAG TPA: hypothetical protein VLE95_04355 [Chlamydiales bacterium]|nr:hypothetical protein [Chlamydiales bacterium]
MLCRSCYKKAPKLGKFPCAECGITTARLWRKNPKGDATMLCVKCYYHVPKLGISLETPFNPSSLSGMQEDGVASSSLLELPLSSEMQEDGVASSSLLDRLQTPQMGKCAGCGTKKAKEWRKNPKGDATMLCVKCYYHVPKLGKSSCAVCGIKKSKVWRKNPKGDATMLCVKCYYHVPKLGKSPCAGCGTKEAKEWRRNPKDKTAMLCSSCFKSGK